MLDLAEIPFFDTLPPGSLNRLRELIPVRHYAQGSIIVRVGEPGRHFQAIASGAVWVRRSASAGATNRDLFLGPGQVFGEMSLFSGTPVTATLVATKETATYCLDGDAFLKLLEAEPSLHINLTKILIERLRTQTHSQGPTPGLIVLAYPFESIHAKRLIDLLIRGVMHYSPGSVLQESAAELSGANGTSIGPSTIIRWRENAPRGRNLVLQIRPQDLSRFTDVLEQRDVVLDISDMTQDGNTHTSLQDKVGIADFSRVYIGTPARRNNGGWAFRISVDELHSVRAQDSRWHPAAVPNIDKIARYLTYKEVGIAMSSGAARGFAHLGVLDVFEQHGIPIDTLCGCSMGGIVALTVARTGNVSDAIAQVRQQLGANKKVRDPSFFPRGSLFRGRKVAAAAEATFGDCTFADLEFPTAVVAADLIRGERVVINRGPVAPAILATSAIPGFYPPIANKRRLMVDGGVVSRVPVDILDYRRCGLRIAINVLQHSGRDKHDIVTDVQQSGSQSIKRLGLKAILGSSWELLGSSGSSNEALQADIVINPRTPHHAGYNFDQFENLVDAGRAAGNERIEAVVDLINSMKRT
ncbi:MAG: NTE family protein [Gammaproteobacteria bacterium]|jgi:NTE family protein